MAGAKFVWGEITGWRNKTECFSFHKEKQIPLKKKEEEEEEEEQEQEEQEERNVILGKHFDVYLFLFIYFIHNHKFSISYFNS